MWNPEDVVRDTIDLICIRGIVGPSHVGGVAYGGACKDMLDSAEHI